MCGAAGLAGVDVAGIHDRVGFLGSDRGQCVGDECVEGVLVSWANAEPDQQCEHLTPTCDTILARRCRLMCAVAAHPTGSLVGGVDDKRGHRRAAATRESAPDGAGSAQFCTAPLCV